MPVIRLSTALAAPAERVFDLARNVEFHVASAGASGERVVGGVASGLLELGDEVTWSARHFGVRQTLSSRITAFDRPRSFRDSMVRGAFKRFDHDHVFEEQGGSVVMRDVFDYDAPFGPLGRIADALFLERHMRRFLETRAAEIKRAAESDAWRRFLV
jgi:ligand-binding SRPBCC domain-containing protein